MLPVPLNVNSDLSVVPEQVERIMCRWVQNLVVGKREKGCIMVEIGQKLSKGGEKDEMDMWRET